MQEMISNVELSKGGSALLISKEGLYMAGNDKDAIMKNNIITDETNMLNKVSSEIVSGKPGNTSIETNGKKNLLYYNSTDITNWAVVVEIPETDLFSGLNKLLIIFVITCVSSIAILAIIIAMFASSL